MVDPTWLVSIQTTVVGEDAHEAISRAEAIVSSLPAPGVVLSVQRIQTPADVTAALDAAAELSGQP